MRITAQPLTPQAFAPFGDVLAPPADFGRVYFDAGLQNGRVRARPSLSMVHVPARTGLPLEVKLMERHEFSSQSFVPLDVSRWLIVVAVSGSDGGPDVSQAAAFVAGAGQGVTYRPGTWHHPLTVLDRPARFAVFMWRDGTSVDEEFRTLAAPFTVDLPR